MFVLDDGPKNFILGFKKRELGFYNVVPLIIDLDPSQTKS